MAADLSVAVVTHNGRELALTTLRSARAKAGPIDVEWLVSDSGSSDGTPEAIEQSMPDVNVIRCSNLGFAHANNAALEVAGGRYVLLLNPDVEIEKGTLADLVAALDDMPQVGAASVVQRGTDGRLLPSIRRFPTPLRDLGEALLLSRASVLRKLAELDLGFEGYFERRSVDWASGAFLVVRRATIDQVGGLDERFFLYSEEIDWCYRIRRAGWDIVHFPIMEVTHHCGPETPERIAELGHSRVLFARKHLSPARAAAIRFSLALNHLLRLLPLAPCSVVVPALRERVRSEAMGLLVVIGLKRPPLSTRARSVAGLGRSPEPPTAAP